MQALERDFVKLALLERAVDDDVKVANAVLGSTALTAFVPATELAPALLARLAAGPGADVVPLAAQRKLLVVLAGLLPAMDAASTGRTDVERTLLPHLVRTDHVRAPARCSCRPPPTLTHS